MTTNSAHIGVSATSSVSLCGDMMGNIIAKSAALDFGIQWALGLVAIAFGTEKFFDLAGSSTFFFLTWQSLQWGGRHFRRQTIQSRMVMLWAVRLGLYLFTRVMKEGEDRRFKHIRNNIPRFMMVWTLQGMWVFLTLLPTLLLNAKKEDKPLSTRDYVGWGIWALGFFFEAVADWQKSAFRANPDNAGKFITSGLWGISRHPNYFGEILCWLGLYISASSVLRGWEHIGIISPLFTTLLLTKVSGIPMLEAAGMKRWGQNPAYLEYVKKTAVLVPFIW